MDQNLTTIASFYATPAELQSAIDAVRDRFPRLENQQQRETAQESVANYLRIAQAKHWTCI